MMGSRVAGAATYADIEGLPEHLTGELVDGELVVTPRPGGRHVLAASTLVGELGAAFQRGRGGPGGWWILFAPELHLGSDVDLAAWRRDRLPSISSSAAFTVPPDWVCEVVSPRTGRLDRAKKLPLYARAGVGHAWLVNPEARTLEVYRKEGDGWRLVAAHGADDLVRAEPFETLELDLLALWGESRRA